MSQSVLTSVVPKLSLQTQPTFEAESHTKVLVTGGTGFLGTNLSFKLMEKKYVVYGNGVAGHRHHDLTDPYQVESLFVGAKPDYVFHLAGYNGGIQFNLDNPADIFTRNTLMAINMLDACRRHKVKKVVSVIASCGYPEKELQDGEWVPTEVMEEGNFLNGQPHHTVACHAYAKRNLLLTSQYFNQQYGLNAVCVCPTTLYGPGDSFDPQRTKVMGAMIKRFVDAKIHEHHSVSCWGTGSAKREFLYVDDASQLLIECMKSYHDASQPLNLGTGDEVSIKELANLVSQTLGYPGQILWDKTKPDGQLRKRLDLTRMKQCLDLSGIKFTKLQQGIIETARYYNKNVRWRQENEKARNSG